MISDREESVLKGIGAEENRAALACPQLALSLWVISAEETPWLLGAAFYGQRIVPADLPALPFLLVRK